MRSIKRFRLLDSKVVQQLVVGNADVLFLRGVAMAVSDGDLVYFPNLPYGSKPENMSAGKMKQINNFRPFKPHVRVEPAEFDYQLAATLMRQLRPLTATAFAKGADTPEPSNDLGE